MGLLSNRVERSEIGAGDHIYTWRAAYAYSHHGIYVGGDKVVHFTREQSINSSGVSSASPFDSTLGSALTFSTSISKVPSTCPNYPDCGFQQPESGVILSCLDCFLSTGSLYRFEYGVSSSFYIAKLRGGTCTTAISDPPQEVIHRAMHLLHNGFGNYDVFRNNCEDFALYCKTGLLVDEQTALGRSSQAACMIGAPLAAILSSPLKLFMSNPVVVVTATAGMYCMSRYAADIGVRTDMVKVKVEDLVVFNAGGEVTEEVAMDHENCEEEMTQDQVDVPASKEAESIGDVIH